MKPADVTRWLSKLAPKMSRNSLSHIRACLSGIFAHATAIGECETNPVRDAKNLSKTGPVPATGCYSREEAEQVIAALEKVPDCRAFVGLCFWAGLRSSEACALKWEDINFTTGCLTVRRSCVRGVVDEPKTESSSAVVPIAPQLASLLAPMRKDKGWVFANGAGNPTCPRELVRRKIRPRLRRAKLEWKGFHSFAGESRPSCATRSGSPWSRRGSSGTSPRQ